MLYLAATLHTLGVALGEHAQTKLRGDPERGSVTMEQVLWGVAAIAFVGIVVAAIRAFVLNKADLIK